MSRSTVAPLPVQLSLFAPAAVPALAVSVAAAPSVAATLSDRALDALAESWGDYDADLDNVILFPSPSRRGGRVGRCAPRPSRG